MNTPTYKEQFDKITEAYFRDEIQPFNPCACFIGNLLNNKRDWISGRICYDYDDNKTIYDYSRFPEAKLCVDAESNSFYELREIYDMELMFLKTIMQHGVEDEDILFEAMSLTLDLLRKIHESKGEIVDLIPFNKRTLKPQP